MEALAARIADHECRSTPAVDNLCRPGGSRRRHARTRRNRASSYGCGGAAGRSSGARNGLVTGYGMVTYRFGSSATPPSSRVSESHPHRRVPVVRSPPVPDAAVVRVCGSNSIERWRLLGLVTRRPRPTRTRALASAGAPRDRPADGGAWCSSTRATIGEGVVWTSSSTWRTHRAPTSFGRPCGQRSPLAASRGHFTLRDLGELRRTFAPSERRDPNGRRETHLAKHSARCASARRRPPRGHDDGGWGEWGWRSPTRAVGGRLETRTDRRAAPSCQISDPSRTFT